jgi:hypothetical protein
MPRNLRLHLRNYFRDSMGRRDLRRRRQKRAKNLELKRLACGGHSGVSSTCGGNKQENPEETLAEAQSRGVEARPQGDPQDHGSEGPRG